MNLPAARLPLTVIVLAVLVPASHSAVAAPDDVVLGAPDLFEPTGKGWGTKKPRRIYNGGVASGLVRKIDWKHWGDRTAKGDGLGSQYKPEGGYYDKPVVVKLRAKKIGQCPGHPKRAYTVLRARFQEKPGGPFGPWFDWAGLQNIC